MSRNLMRMALMMAATAAYAQGDIFGSQSPKLDIPKGSVPSDKQKCQPKAQHEFLGFIIKIFRSGSHLETLDYLLRLGKFKVIGNKFDKEK